MDSVKKCRAYREKDYEYAEVVREKQPKPKEGEQAPGICGVADITINAFLDYTMIFDNCHVDGELMFQGENREPANNKPTDDQAETDNWKYCRSIAKASNALQAEKNAEIYGDENSHPQNPER